MPTLRRKTLLQLVDVAASSGVLGRSGEYVAV
jgi:hypothetical protein